MDEKRMTGKAYALTLGGAVGAVLCGALATSATGKLALGAIAGLVFLAWRPAVALVLILILCQEVEPGGSFSGMTVFGSDAYFGSVGKVPVTVILLAIGTLAVLAKHGRELKHHRPFSPTIAIVLISIVGSLFSGLAFGMDVASALGQVARPFVIFALAWILGANLGANLQALGSVSKVGALAFVALAALGLPSALVSGAATGEQLVYYDTATAAIAGASFLAVLRAKHLSRMELILTLCTAIVLLVSFRRSILISLVISAVIVLVLNKHYRGMIKRVILSSGAIILAGAVALPSLLSTFADRLAVSLATVQGTGDDVSTAGHLDDVIVGLQHAFDRPLGYGPLTPQLTGLFVQSGYIYVHNELLLDWLRFGFVGFLAVLLLQISLLRDAFKALFQEPTRVSVAVVAASFLMPIFVIASLSAPFLTTTNRWPALIGLAAGILAAHNSSQAGNALLTEDLGPFRSRINGHAAQTSGRFIHREIF